MTPERYEQISRLCQQALECEPARRAEFLAGACGKDEALCREVESLLDYHTRAESFIEQPALELAARKLAEKQRAMLIGQSLGHYRILSPLGAGGMGEVWLAEDTKLGRRVAVKLLPAGFATDTGRVRRFAREARAASALNHPNILTIHEIGEAGGINYIVTEYVEGETLRQRMTVAPEGRMRLTEAVDAAAQIAAALAAAHDAGIVHRDIKPENVMLRRDGLVKVLDFGLAKLVPLRISDFRLRIEETETSMQNPQSMRQSGNLQSAIRNPQLTASGLVMGTPRYMSPEQVRGEKVDARTDIFSLGLVLYEMVAGRVPFTGTTSGDLMAAILRDEPPPLRAIPHKLEQIISQALSKDRAQRYQNAQELLRDLKTLRQRIETETRPDEETPAAQAAAYIRPVSTAGDTHPVRRRRPVIGALIIVVAALISALAGWIYFDRQPALTEKDTILLADFENRTGEDIFDLILRQGLAIQLQQSPFLNLFPEAQVRHEMKLMKRAPGERVTTEVAREICERQNLKALIAGSIVPLGTHYVITLEAINGQNGESLAREQVQAENREQVLQALSQAATRLRERLGESLSSIQSFDRPLQEGTTASPEAFRAYSQAIELAVSGRLGESIPFYQRAVELDPDFAHAYSQLAIMYWATDRPGLAAEYAKKSYELRERAGELEKFRITHKYLLIFAGDLHRAVEVLKLQRQTYPREWTGPLDLAVVYMMLGQSDQAVAEARESIRLNPRFAAPYNILALGLLRLNRFAEAVDVLVQATQRGLDLPAYQNHLYQLAFINGGAAGMQQQLGRVLDKQDEHITLSLQSGASAFAGQWRRAQESSRRAIDLAMRGDTKEVAARYATEQALQGAVFGDCRSAGIAATKGLKLARSRATLPRAALALGICGEAGQVASLVDELARLYPADTLINELWIPVIRAALLLQQNDAKQALELLQPVAQYEAAAEFWPQYLRGQARLKLGQSAEAAAEFEHILAHRGHGPLSPLYPLAHLGRARAAALTGDTAQSRQAYNTFLDVWRQADPDLPVLTEAVKEFGKR